MRSSFNTHFPKYILIIGLAAVAVRLAFVFYYKPLNEEYYWEYGEIAKNIKSGYGYSLISFGEKYPDYVHKPGVIPHKSAYMPPGYVYYILPFIYIDNVPLRNLLILSLNIVYHLIALLFLYLLTKRMFSEQAAVAAVAIFALLPEFIYASATYGTTTIYHLAVISALYYLSKADEQGFSGKYLLISASILAILLLFRQEILLFSAMLIFYALSKRNYKSAIVIFSLSSAVLIPWQIRNYEVFGKYVPLSTSGGVNFYRGHNPYAPDCWGDEPLYQELYKYKDSANFELYMSKVFYDFSLNSIAEDPLREVSFTFEKLFNLWIVNPKYPRANHILYLAPWLILLPLSLYGMWRRRSFRRYKFFYMFFIYSSLLAVAFFALPRYQTMMKIALVPFAGYALSIFISYISKPSR